jgi:hypothetical protein
MMSGPQQMAPKPEEILDHAMDRGEPLEMSDRLEAAHLTLPLPGRLVGNFRPVVRVLVRAVDDGRHHCAAGGRRLGS